MLGYVIRRIIGALLVMLAVSTLVFFMLRLVPGDPIGAMLADAGSDEAREALTRKFGFDQPVVIQFFRWIKSSRASGLIENLYLEKSCKYPRLSFYHYLKYLKNGGRIF